MADLIHVTGKKRRQRLMLVSIALLIGIILVAGINLIAPIAFAQSWDDYGYSSSPGCCCCCGAAILPLVCLGLTYSWQADKKEGQ
ncbi:MAG: hypothetical protein WBZ29_08355 [Methanocella sp.]